MIKRPLYPAPALHTFEEIEEASTLRKFEDTMQRLHSILVAGNAKPGEVRHAKERMLKVLEERRRMPFPGTLIPPLAGAPRKRKRQQQTALGRSPRVRLLKSSPGSARAAANRNLNAPKIAHSL